MSDTVISIPSGAGRNPTSAPVPHDRAREKKQEATAEGDHVNNSMSNISTAAKPLDMIIYFADKSGLHMKIEDGQNINAGELFELVLEDMKLMTEDESSNAGAAADPFSSPSVLDLMREVFSFWLVSDLLELQLKPTHVPFKLICYWEELLDKYTSAAEESRQRDEPVIIFKRNVYYHRSDEKKVTHERTLQLLYHEAMTNMLKGRYPLSQEECDEMAILQAVITEKELRTSQNSTETVDDTFGTVAYFKTRIAQYLPAHLSKRHWIFHTSTNPEKRLAAGYASRVDAGDSRKSLVQLYTEYLNICRRLPYYGAAYLRGQAEHPGKRGLLSAPVDDPVYVAVNVDGVYIIDMDDVVLLLGLYYEEMSWQLVESKRVDNPNSNCMPCLFLQFQEKKQADVTKLLQIFSKEAGLMDNLIDSCVQLKTATKRQRLATGETKDEIRNCEIVKQFERLALITIDSKGCLVDRGVRTPRSANK